MNKHKDNKTSLNKSICIHGFVLSYLIIIVGSKLTFDLRVESSEEMIALSKFQLLSREVSVTVIGWEREIKLRSLSHYCPFGKARIHIFFTRLLVKQQAILDPLVLKGSQKDYLEFKTVQKNTTKNTPLTLPQIRGNSQIIGEKIRRES